MKKTLILMGVFVLSMATTLVMAPAINQYYLKAQPTCPPAEVGLSPFQERAMKQALGILQEMREQKWREMDTLWAQKAFREMSPEQKDVLIPLLSQEAQQALSGPQNDLRLKQTLRNWDILHGAITDLQRALQP